MDRAVDPDEARAMFNTNLPGRIAGMSPRAAKAAACLYTVTPDRGFIVDRHPEQDRVTAVSTCSGHGFKHSAGLGLAVAEGPSSIDFAPFGLSRFSGRHASA